MRTLLVPAIVLAWSTIAAAQDRDDGYVMDYEDIGGVIVYADGSAQSQQGQGQGIYQQEPMYADQGGGPYYYFGPHPDGQGGWDPTEGAHAHEVPPFDPFLFTQENGYYYFIGDPVDFGYGGADVYGYYGAHPVALVYGGGYCYYGGYHRHRFAPHGRFAFNNGWAIWSGPVSPWYAHYRDRYARYFQNVYPRHFVNGPSGPHIRIRPAGGMRAFAPPVQRIFVPGQPGVRPVQVVPSHAAGQPGSRPAAPTTVRDHRRR